MTIELGGVYLWLSSVEYRRQDLPAFFAECRWCNLAIDVVLPLLPQVKGYLTLPTRLHVLGEIGGDDMWLAGLFGVSAHSSSPFRLQ